MTANLPDASYSVLENMRGRGAPKPLRSTRSTRRIGNLDRSGCEKSLSRKKELRHGRTTPLRCLLKPSNHMETTTHTAPTVALNRLVSRFGYASPEATIGEMIDYGRKNHWVHSAGTILGITPTGRFRVSHWKRNRTVGPRYVCAIYSANVEVDHGCKPLISPSCSILKEGGGNE
jgi:hypothetical protein